MFILLEPDLCAVKLNAAQDENPFPERSEKIDLDLDLRSFREGVFTGLHRVRNAYRCHAYGRVGKQMKFEGASDSDPVAGGL